MGKEPKRPEDLSMWEDAHAMIRKAKAESIETAWDRLERQTPHCKFCDLGTT